MEMCAEMRESNEVKMGFYKYVREAWKKPKQNLGEEMKNRLIKWRKEPTTVKLVRPTRIDRARGLGYKAKQGFFVVRQRVNRGGRKKEQLKHGRRSKRQSRRKTLSKNYKQVAEERTQKAYKNLVVVNSYYVAKDKDNYWYEIILVDPEHTNIKKGPLNIRNLAKDRHRVIHGKTSAGKKARGLR